jgi:hypothetical protein
VDVFARMREFNKARGMPVPQGDAA